MGQENDLQDISWFGFLLIFVLVINYLIILFCCFFYLIVTCEAFFLQLVQFLCVILFYSFGIIFDFLCWSSFSNWASVWWDVRLISSTVSVYMLLCLSSAPLVCCHSAGMPFFCVCLCSWSVSWHCFSLPSCLIIELGFFWDIFLW